MCKWLKEERTSGATKTARIKYPGLYASVRARIRQAGKSAFSPLSFNVGQVGQVTSTSLRVSGWPGFQVGEKLHVCVTT